MCMFINGKPCFLECNKIRCVARKDIVQVDGVVCIEWRIFSVQRLKVGTGFGSMVPDRQSRMMKMACRSPSRGQVRHLVKKKVDGTVLR